MDMSSSLKGPLLPSEAEVRISAELARNTAACLGEGATSKAKKGEAEPLPHAAGSTGCSLSRHTGSRKNYGYSQRIVARSS
jgi:hypothetical protein